MGETTRFGLLLTAALTACAAPGSVFYQGNGGQTQLTPEQRFDRRWTGRPEDDVLMHFGKPRDVLPLSNGNEVYSYHYENQISRARGFASGQFAGSHALSVGTFCDHRFEIDNVARKVVRATIRGTDCDYDE